MNTQMNQKILSLRMERQHLLTKADESEYISLYRRMYTGTASGSPLSSPSGQPSMIWSSTGTASWSGSL